MKTSFNGYNDDCGRYSVQDILKSRQTIAESAANLRETLATVSAARVAAELEAEQLASELRTLTADYDDAKQENNALRIENAKLHYNLNVQPGWFVTGTKVATVFLALIGGYHILGGF